MHFFRFVSWFARFPKRQRTVVATLLLTMGMLIATFLDYQDALIYLPFYLLYSYILIYLAILENINKWEKILLFLAPLVFELSIFLFYFFVPARWLTRIPFLVIFAICIYALLLSQNIFNVGVEKSIALVRAAFNINFLLMTITSMIANIIILNLDLPIWLYIIAIGVVHFPILWQFIWSVAPSEEFKKWDVKYAFIVCVILSELMMILIFIPLQRQVMALVITSVFYSLSGLLQAYLQERLFKERVREFVGVLVIVSIMALFSARW